LIALLLGGNELNPGLLYSLDILLKSIYIIAIYTFSVGRMMLNLLVVTDTWMKSSDHEAISNEIAPAGYGVLHLCRDDVSRGGGVAIVYRYCLEVIAVLISTMISSAECLVT